MNNYDYCMVHRFDQYVGFRCTDPKLSSEIYDQIKKYYPSAQLEEKETLVTGDDFGFLLKGFTGASRDGALWFTIKLLCAKSWEPLGSSDGSHMFKRLSTS